MGDSAHALNHSLCIWAWPVHAHLLSSEAALAGLCPLLCWSRRLAHYYETRRCSHLPPRWSYGRDAWAWLPYSLMASLCPSNCKTTRPYDHRSFWLQTSVQAFSTKSIESISHSSRSLRDKIFRFLVSIILRRFTNVERIPRILGNSVAHAQYHPCDRYQAVFFSLPFFREKSAWNRNYSVPGLLSWSFNGSDLWDIRYTKGV